MQRFIIRMDLVKCFADGRYRIQKANGKKIRITVC